MNEQMFRMFTFLAANPAEKRRRLLREWRHFAKLDPVAAPDVLQLRVAAFECLLDAGYPANQG